MSIWYKQGVYGDLLPEAAEGLRRLERAYDKRHKDVYVTSIRDGSHMAGSYHPWGKAFDVRKNGMTKAFVKRAVVRGFDVVEHSTHFHIEWDPK